MMESSKTQMVSNTTLFYHFLPTKLEEEEQNLKNKKNTKNTKNTSLIKAEPVWINPETPKVLLELFDPWEIKKVLTDSDVGSHCRLLLKSETVKNFIYPNWDPKLIYDIEFGLERKEVNVKDLEKGSEHKLCFSKLRCSGSYILNGGWNPDFVKRRELKVNDLIGLYWKPELSLFAFAVLDRARPTSTLSLHE